MKVPFLDLKAQQRQVKDEILPLWEAILDGAGFIGGEHVAGFENEFAEACGTRHCVAMSNGTAALQMILEALGLGPEDEVIVPVNSFIATAEAVTHAGGRVRFVDVLPDTYNMDPEAVRRAINGRTRGIVPVHLYGQPADLDVLGAVAAEHGLWLVEDAAQAHLAEYKGRRVGAFGRAAEFSFYPGKNLGACGDAGAVTTDDDELAARLRMFRDHGSARKYVHEFEGHNNRCDALQAAALRVKLKRLPEWNEARRRAARRYCELLADVEEVVLPTTAPDCLPVWHLFVVQVDERDRVQRALEEQGVSTALHYPTPLHLQRAYGHLGLEEGSFPVAEAYARRLLSLPMFPEITEEQIVHVCESLKQAVRQAKVSAG